MLAAMQVFVQPLLQVLADAPIVLATYRSLVSGGGHRKRSICGEKGPGGYMPWVCGMGRGAWEGGGMGKGKKEGAACGLTHQLQFMPGMGGECCGVYRERA